MNDKYSSPKNSNTYPGFIIFSSFKRLIDAVGNVKHTVDQIIWSKMN